MLIRRAHTMLVTVASPGPSPSPASGVATTAGPSWVPWLTLVAAVIAAVVTLTGAVLQRRSGKEAAAASQKSAEASERSAKAAEAAVELNAETATTAGRRSDAESLSKRYQDAAGQLGHENAAVRLAGVYAMARLADDWEEQRQTCVDVLCAYLRMSPQVLSDGTMDDGDLQVRGSIASLIVDRTRGPIQYDAPGPWSECNFNLRGAYLKNFVVHGSYFGRRVNLREARFSGINRIGPCRFALGGIFADLIVEDGATHFWGLVSEIRGGFDLSGAVVKPSAALSVAPQISPGPDLASWFNLDRIDCAGEFILSVRRENIDADDSIAIPNLRLSGRFALRVTGRDADPNKYRLPVVEAKGWKLEEGCDIRIDNVMLGQSLFVASEWQGLRVHGFAEFYD